MHNADPDSTPLPVIHPETALRLSHRRRPAFLAILSAGLILFLLWLPDELQESLWKAVVTQGGVVILLGLFAVLTVSVIGTAGQRLDAQVFRTLNMRAYPRWLDYGMWLATQLGNMLTAAFIAIFFLILDHRGLAAEIVLGTITLWLIVEIIKALTDRSRPFLDIEESRIIGRRERGRSYPSGHAAQIYFLALLLSYRLSIGVGGILALYVIAMLVGFTRMYVGVHYPRDILGGAVLGSIWGFLATTVFSAWSGMEFNP